MSLVNGVQTRLKATALSIQGVATWAGSPSGDGSRLGDGVVTLDVQGRLDELRVEGGIAALGKGSQAVQGDVRIGGLDAIRVEVSTGEAPAPSVER
jgi:hypothetical protein